MINGNVAAVFIICHGAQLRSHFGTESLMQTISRAMEIDNPAPVLLNQDGVFEVTSPWGSIFEVTCRRGSRMSFREISRPKCRSRRGSDRTMWRIRRVE